MARKLPLHTKILIGGLIGVAGGVLAHFLLGDDARLAAFIRYVTLPIGQIFLRLLFMLVIPLIFSALVLGVAGMGDPRHLGRVGFKALAYTVVVSAIAVLLGVTLVNVFRPGEGLSPGLKARLAASALQKTAAPSAAPASAAPPEEKSPVDLLVEIVPRNPVKAAAEGDFLGVMFFSLMVGLGLALTRTPAALRFQEAVEGLFDVSMRLIDMVIAFAPLGVAALLFNLTAQLGYEVLGQLARYVGVVLLALAIHQFVVYSLAVKLLGGMSPWTFFRGIQEAMVTAFSTASSNATLPTALRVAEEELRLPPNVSRFVLTIGATMNQNGTALFEGVTVLFLAQFYGVPLTLTQQLTVVVICILGGVGTAGVPAGSIPVVAMILGLVGIPAEGIGLILGVDRFLDMCRTTLNVSGDLAAAVVVSRGEQDSLPAAAAAEV
ncbi:MAG TPA: dicarboxylate/amino acid:cation symporter [Thermoanaerobaculia bacterium]|jgi:DAACS family dicarboxylate/amino acid:cation (Na+ or H+) symporter|nr:dicarboxylate/amino acid:cation symporter [Thermoanaerobaculia bacterium]